MEKTKRCKNTQNEDIEQNRMLLYNKITITTILKEKQVSLYLDKFVH